MFLLSLWKKKLRPPTNQEKTEVILRMENLLFILKQEIFLLKEGNYLVVVLFAKYLRNRFIIQNLY